MRHLFARFRIKLPLSKRNYWIVLILTWIYTVIWMIVFVWIWHYWRVSLPYKIIVTLILFCGAPTLGELVWSYDRYRKNWDKHFGNSGTSAKRSIGKE